MPDLTPTELTTIRNTVADEAAGWYGGPFNFGRDDAARYVSEGYLGNLVRAHSLAEVWRAVAAVIDADPSVLTRTPAEREQGRTARRDQATAAQARALAAVKGGDFDTALAELDDGERIDPLHRTGHRTWDDLRAVVARRRQAAGVSS